jgi:general secretion pathway protein G
MISGRRLILGFGATIAVLVLVLALLLPRVVCGKKQARARKLVADLNSIAEALGAYRAGHGAYPAIADGDQGALRRALAPTYLAELPERDPWGHPFAIATSAASYSLGSYGKDGVADAAATAGEHPGEDADTWVVDGRFRSYPALGCD